MVEPMVEESIVVVGASAGGVEALRQFVAGFPQDFAAAVVIVLHVPPGASSALPRILTRAGRLEARHAHDGDVLERGKIFVAPPDHHAVIANNRVRLTRGPTVNTHRPAIDPLFFSAAREHGARAVGVILSGTLDDGTAGLHAIKQRGGLAVVQDPDDALYSGMPRSAMLVTVPDIVLPAEHLAEAIDQRLRERGAPVAGGEGTMASDDQARQAEQRTEDVDEPPVEGTPSTYGCPACDGVLWEVSEGKVTRFRCRVGHVYTPEGLFAAQSDGLESALWIAYRALHESASLSERLATKAATQGLHLAAEQYRSRASDAKLRARVVLDVLEKGRIDQGVDPKVTDPNSGHVPGGNGGGLPTEGGGRPQ